MNSQRIKRILEDDKSQNKPGSAKNLLQMYREDCKDSNLVGSSSDDPIQSREIRGVVDSNYKFSECSDLSDNKPNEASPLNKQSSMNSDLLFKEANKKKQPVLDEVKENEKEVVPSSSS